MKSVIQAKFVGVYAKEFHFPAKDGKPSKDWKGFGISVVDEDAFSDMDRFFTITCDTDKAILLGINKPQFEKENLGKVLNFSGILTKSFGKITFTLDKITVV